MNLESTYLYKLNQSFAIVLAISTLTLVISFGLEIVERLQPCKICQLQRLCFFGFILLSIAGIISHAKNRFRFLLLSVSFLSVILACYHIGIQLEIFSDSCSVVSPVDLKDFKNMMFKLKPVCSSIHWIFGIPISVWSFLIPLVNFIVMATTLRSQKTIISKKGLLQS